MEIVLFPNCCVLFCGSDLINDNMYGFVFALWAYGY
jgi:hypothetical protein